MPTAMKMATGARKSRINRKEPKPELGVPSPPDDATDAERMWWFNFGGVLAAMRVLTKSDGAYLKQLVETQVECDELAADIKAKGRTQVVATKSGDAMERQRPQVAMLSDARKRLMMLLTSGGLTPSARSKVNAQEVADDSQADAYFG